MIAPARTDEPVRYFRCAYRDSYYEVRGAQVTYFAPQVPDGAPAQWSLADLERCAARRPATDREITAEEVADVRKLLLDAAELARKRDADRRALEETTFR